MNPGRRASHQKSLPLKDVQEQNDKPQGVQKNPEHQSFRDPDSTIVSD